MIEWLILGIIGFAILSYFISGSKKSVIPSGHTGLRYVNEVFAKALEPGIYRYFDPLGSRKTVVIPTTPMALSQYQIEVTSRDKFAFRLTLTPLVTICDAQAYNEGNPNAEAHFGDFGHNPEFRLTRVNAVLSSEAIAAVALHDLEGFLSDPKVILPQIKPALEAVMPGVQLDDIVINAITMPPEVRKMFTEVERAKREGLAKLERAKAEQASLRALANAARNMNGNPELAQLRTLQIMESSSGPKTFILGDTPQASLNPSEAGDKS